MHNSAEFRIGKYRPIYLWAGPGTIRMNQLKFMGVNVNENVHLNAHKRPGAEIVVHDMYQNWIHLTYSWGFPPEIELEDWNSFEVATREYHRLNAQVFAYIQTSNCVYSDSFTKKNWYANTPDGEKIYYYSGRFMTCLQNHDWLDYLKERIKDAIDRGADGIFFDNLWNGLQPNSLFNTWLGGAGCYCETCQQTYLQETGFQAPTFIDLKSKKSIRYIEWRADKTTQVVKTLSDYARTLKSAVVISANDYDPIMRPVKLIFGIDFEPLAKIQDITMIENFALPKWEEKNRKILVNNALTVRNTQPFLPESKHLSMLSYDAGIGFDDVYPTRRILTAMAESAALGCSMTTKGTEYHDGQMMTLLTAPEYKEQQQAIGKLHHWLDDHQIIFQQQTKRLAEVAILHPGDVLWQNWHQVAPLFFTIQQTLLANGIPWKVIRNIDNIDGLKQIIYFDDQFLPAIRNMTVQFIDAFSLKTFKKFSESFFNRNPSFRSGLSLLTDQLIRGYHGYKILRKIMDGLGMAKLVTHTPFFVLPDKAFQNELLALISPQSFRVNSDHPVLMDIWETKQSEINIHLLNYHNSKQEIYLNIPDNLNVKIEAYDQKIEFFRENKGKIRFDLDLYCICTVFPQEEK